MRIILTLDRDAGKREENDYVQSLRRVGFEPNEVEIAEPGSAPSGDFDGLVLGGGCDVDPQRYGQGRRPGARLELDTDRDATDFALFERAWRDGVPIFGICRGLQVVNVALGGTLIQDIASERPGLVHQRPPRQKQRLDHDVSPVSGTRLAAIAGSERFVVNSRHHQAILDAAPGLAVSAHAPDGMIEAVESPDPDRWMLAVQWHPENLPDNPVSRRLFSDFALAVRERNREGISSPSGLLTRA